jgi:hypothetical protein
MQPQFIIGVSFYRYYKHCLIENIIPYSALINSLFYYGKEMFIIRLNNSYTIILFVLYCIIFISCNPLTKTNIDLTIIKRELPWESSYNNIKNKLKDKLDLTFSKRELFKQSTSYIYHGGSFKRIKTSSWKFIFYQDALEAIYIWIIYESADKTESTYKQLTKYFNSIADYEKGRDYNSWLYDQAYYGPPRLHDSNIILEKKDDSILIKIMHASYASID